jgi:TldD protein
VAPDFLTVVDDPTVPDRAGSHGHDDEGVAGRAVVLLDAGVVADVLLDGTTTGFAPGASTGHARRPSWRDLPRPRLTNTVVRPGPHDDDDVVGGVSRAILVERLDRAAFDARTGVVQLSVPEAWLLEHGRRTAPLSDLVLVGDALAVLDAVDAVGVSPAWDDGCGSCGREGSWVPVAVAGPLVRVGSGAFGVL